MIRTLPTIILALFALFVSPASAVDDRLGAIESSAIMYQAGSNGACPGLRLNWAGMLAMFKSHGMQADDVAAGGRYHTELAVAMAIAKERYSQNADGFCAAARAVYAHGATASVLELEK